MKQRKWRNPFFLIAPTRLFLLAQVSYQCMKSHYIGRVKAETILTLAATLKAHKYSNVRQLQRQQHLCVYKTERSPVGVELAPLEHETRSAVNHPHSHDTLHFLLSLVFIV